MKIVDRKTFVALQPGTVFSIYRPQMFGELCIKGESINDGRDYYFQPLNDSIDCNGSADLSMILDAAEQGASIEVNLHYETRDGLFEKDQMYAIWEKRDVEKLHIRIGEAMKTYEPASQSDKEESNANN